MGFVKGPVSLNPPGITNCMGQDATADNIIYLAGSQDLLLVIIKSLEDLEELTELPGMNPEPQCGTGSPRQPCRPLLGSWE